jgi:hypothetical protein
MVVCCVFVVAQRIVSIPYIEQLTCIVWFIFFTIDKSQSSFEKGKGFFVFALVFVEESGAVVIGALSIRPSF